MLKQNITVEDVCNTLNELLAIDYDCIYAIVSHREKCNSLVADHPTIQVQQDKTDEFPKLGIIGIINGMFGIREDGMGAICFEIDDDNEKILCFKPAPLSKS